MHFWRRNVMHTLISGGRMDKPLKHTACEALWREYHLLRRGRTFDPAAKSLSIARGDQFRCVTRVLAAKIAHNPTAVNPGLDCHCNYVTLKRVCCATRVVISVNVSHFVCVSASREIIRERISISIDFWWKVARMSHLPAKRLIY